MKAQSSVTNTRRNWPLWFGVLGPLLLLVAGLLLMTSLGAAASSGVSQPQTLTLAADPAIIPPNGLSTSTLTADVRDALGDPVDDGTVVVFTTTLGTFPDGLTFTPEPTGVMTIEAESDAIVKVGSWMTYTEPLASGGEIIYSNVVSDRVSYTFTGTAVSAIFQKQYNAGIARVYLDGELAGEIDTYWDDGSGTGKLYQQEEPIAAGLPYAPHLVEVEVTAMKNISSTDTFLVLDAFRIYGYERNDAYLTSGGVATITLTSAITPGTAQVTACAGLACDSAAVLFGLAQPQALNLTANPTSLPADGVSFSTLTAGVSDPWGDPVDDGTVVVFTTTLGTFPGGLTFTPKPSGMMTVEAESPEVGKMGTWTPYSDPQASGGGGIYSNGIGDRVTYTFTGTAISVVFQKQFNAGIAHIYLDGVLYRQIDTYDPGVLYQQQEPIASDLPYAPHQVEVVVTGLKNPAASDTYLVVDAFRIYGYERNDAYLTSNGVSTITLTSIITPGSALVTACAGPACDSKTVLFWSAEGGYTYLPIILKNITPPPPLDCEELIQNGGFENDTGWIIGPTPRPARYVTETVHSGNRSMLLGIKPGEDDVVSYSSVRQTINLSPGIYGATLAFWYYPFSDLDDGDRQECLLLDEDDHLLAIVMRTNVNTAAWTRVAFDVSAYAGHAITVYCNAFNDGDGEGVAGLYLDDVSVQACSAIGPTPTSQPTPTPPISPDCYPVLWTTVGVGHTPHSVAVNSAANRVYVTNHDDDTLSVIDSVTYALLHTAPVGNSPNAVAYNPANDRLYVTNWLANTVSVLRASDLALVHTISVGSQPNGLAVNEATNRVYVANFGSGTVSVIDGATNSVIQTIPVGVEPSMVAVNPIMNKAYVSLHGESHVAVIDGAGNANRVDVYSGAPYGITVDVLRNLVYIATIDTYRIAVLDGSDDTFQGWAEIRRLPGAEPVPLRLIAVNPLIGTSGHLFVTTVGEDEGYNKFLLLPKGWPEYFARAHALDLNEAREGIAFEPTTLRVFATSRTDDLVAVFFDGEPVCPNNFSMLGDYQITICIANPDGTCQRTFTR